MTRRYENDPPSSGAKTQVGRLVPEAPLPPYTYVPGRFPHPHGDPLGHSQRAESTYLSSFDASELVAQRAYRFGIDLFNHGYYWEAHEYWEQCWVGLGRQGPAAWLVQGLIKLAAAAVKIREGISAGTRHLAAGAQKRFKQVREASGSSVYGGLDLNDLIQWSGDAAECARDEADDCEGVLVLYSFKITLVA